MVQVRVYSGDIEKALRLLKRKLSAEGVMKAYKLSQVYEKPSDKKRRKRREAANRRNRQALRRGK